MNKRDQERYWRLMGAIPIEYRQHIAALHRYATTLHRLDENACNGWPMLKTEVRDGKVYRFDVENEAWRKRDEAKEARIMKRIAKIADLTGWTIETQDDPRGWPMSVKTKEGVDISFLACY